MQARLDSFLDEATVDLAGRNRRGEEGGQKKQRGRLTNI
jgi:hypothetical protein